MKATYDAKKNSRLAFSICHYLGSKTAAQNPSVFLAMFA
jgi:hypothetical protein